MLFRSDLPTDAPLVTKVGELYVGRLPQYHRGVANIRFAVDEMKKVVANADYDHLTMVGHSMGADVSLYFARMYPDQVRKIVTLDNLRVPFMTDGRFKILSFRSNDPNFKTDPGVLPTPEQAKAEGIDIVKTPFQHTWMSDRGPEDAREQIQSTLEKFLGRSSSSDLSPVPTDNPLIAKMGPGPYP